MDKIEIEPEIRRMYLSSGNSEAESKRVDMTEEMRIS